MKKYRIVGIPALPKDIYNKGGALQTFAPGGAPCPRGQYRDNNGNCVSANWNNIQAADSYTGMYGGYDGSGIKNLKEVKASARKGKKFSDYVLRGGKSKADVARNVGKTAGQYFNMPGEAIEPTNFTKAGLDRYYKDLDLAKKGYKKEEKAREDYEKARKKVQKSKDPNATSNFKREYEEKGWDRFDENVIEGSGPNAQYSAKEARQNWGDPEEWKKFTNMVGNAATAIPLLGAAGAMGGAGAAILENPYVQAGLTAYGLYDATTNTLPEAYKDLKEGNYWEAAGNTALGALDLVPGIGLASKGAKLIPKAVNYAGDLAGNIGKGFKTLSKAESQGSILSKYRNIEELRHAKGYKDFKSANEAYPELFPTQESFMQAKNEANALLKEYTPKFEKQFGKGKDDEILVFGAHDDVGKLNSKEGFLVDDEFAKSTGLENDLTNQQKFLGDTYQLEYSGYFNQNPGYGGNKEFAKYLSNQIEPVIKANKLKAPAQVRRTSSFNRPVKTIRGDQELTLNYDDLLEGDVIYPEHNWSTTTDMTGNVWGSGDPTSKVAIINVPEGQSAFRPNMYTGSQYVDEQELLLPSKLGYKVSGVNTKGFGSDSPRFIFDVHNPYRYGGALDLQRFVNGGGNPCGRGMYMNERGECVRLDWNIVDLASDYDIGPQWTNSYQWERANGAPTSNLNAVKVYAKKGKKLSDWIFRGGKTRIQDAEAFGKKYSDEFNLGSNEPLIPANTTREGIKRFKNYVKDAANAQDKYYTAQKKIYDKEEKERKEYENARKKVQSGKMSTSTFASQYNEKGWSKYDPNVMKEGYKGQYQDAVNEANARKEKNLGVTEAALEFTGAPALLRIAKDPVGTVKGVAQTVGDVATLPIGAAQGIYNYATTGDFDMGQNIITGANYGEGVPAVLDVASVLPGIGGASKFLKASDAVNDLGKFVTTKTPIKNTYKLNPKALKDKDVDFLWRWQADQTPKQLTQLNEVPSEYTGRWFMLGKPEDTFDYLKIRPGSGTLKGVAMPKGTSTLPEDASKFTFSDDLRKVERIVPEDLLNKTTDYRIDNNPWLVNNIDNFNFGDDLEELSKIYKNAKVNPHWLKGYGMKVPSQLPGSSNTTMMSGLGNMNMANHEIKNINYFQQLLDSGPYSASQRQYIQGVINSVKKQNGIATQRQIDFLNNLKTGKFNFGKKAYAKGGSTSDYIELDIPKSKIKEYISQGYIVEEV